MLPASFACELALSVTLTVKLYVPGVVGVPVIDAGADADRLSPGGSCPAAIDHVYGCTPPLAKKFCK